MYRRSRDADQLHVAILDNFMRKVLPDVNVLGVFPAANDVVFSLNARSILFIHWIRLLLCKTHVLEEVVKLLNL